MSTRAVIPKNPAAAKARMLTRVPGSLLQRKCDCGGSAEHEGECEDCKKKKLQRRATGDGPGTAPPIVHDVLRSAGQPLDEQTRAFFEPRFGYDFSKVRIHTDSQAHQSARAVNAAAYTVGNDLVFSAGRFAPSTRSGLQLMAHELTHVVQQSKDGSASIQRKLEVGAANDSLEQEADRLAEEITSTSRMTVGWPVPPPSNGSKAKVQRAVADSASDLSAPAATTLPPNTGLIVEDDVSTVGQEQMRKSEFLEGLRDSVCAAADSELAAVGRTAQGCPFIERWIARLHTRTSQYIERAIRKYAPESANASTARDYFPAVSNHVRQGVRRWATTGDLSGVPPELMSEMAGGGILGAITGAISSVAGAIGGAFSGIGKLFTKAKDGGAREADPAAMQAKLGAGTVLDGGVKVRMETAFGHDFSRVRVHADSRAAELSAIVNARAFTIGNDVAFAAGEYRPGTLIGDALIAHELAHVMQQSDGAAATEPMSKGGTEYNSLEEDADTSAVGAMVSLWTGAKSALKSLGQSVDPRLRSGLRLQRCGGPDAAAPTPMGQCTQDQLDTVKKVALPRARKLTSTAFRMLGQAGSNQDVAQAIQNNFKGATPAHIDEIKANFVKIAGALENRIYYCLPPMGEVPVRGTDGVKRTVVCLNENAQSFGTLRELFLCYEFFGFKEGKQAMTLVHEAVHRGLGVTDIKYEPSGGMAVRDALKNPDSYVYLAVDLETIAKQAAAAAQGTIQKKETDGTAGDQYEQEADRVAQQVTNSSLPLNSPTQSLSRGSSAGLRIQRSPQTSSGSTPSTQTNSSAAAKITETRTSKSSLLIEDSAPEQEAGQMRKSQFLEELRVAVCAAADAELAAAKRNTQGCPFVEKWIGYYRGRTAQQVTQALQRYAPEAAAATEARDYIPPVAARVRRSVATWVATGKIQGVPEELANQLPGTGLLGAVGSFFSGAVSAVSSLVSGVGHALGSIFAKSRSGSTGPAKNPQEVIGQLGTGHPLDPSVKFRMESALGHDFSDVRVHTDQKAAALSKSMNARALTIGRNVAFDSEQYQPGTVIGDVLLAHELAHVVQQRGATPHADGGVGDARYNALEEDADAAAANAAVSLWKPNDPNSRNTARKSASNMKSGLRLSRCGGEKGPGISYGSDCSEDSQKKISSATNQAKNWVNSAVLKVNTLVSAPDKADSKTITQVKRHFHIADMTKSSEDVLKLQKGLAAIQSGFGRVLPFQCETTCPEGEVAHTLGFFRIYGDIHLCPRFFDDNDIDPFERSATVVHEMAHKYAGKGEQAYYKANMRAYLQLSTDDALDNADSFAQFVRYVQD